MWHAPPPCSKIGVLGIILCILQLHGAWVHGERAPWLTLALPEAATRPPSRQTGGQGVGERVGDAFYPTWRAGSNFWRLAQNKAQYAM